MKKQILSISKLVALLAICCVFAVSCSEDEPDKGKTIVVEGLSIGSSHGTPTDKLLFQGSGGGMVEAKKIEVPGKIKEVTAYLQKQDKPDVKLDLASSAKRMIGATSFNAPTHFHPNIPEDQETGMYNFYFKLKDEKGEESELVLIEGVEIKIAPVSIDKSSVKMSNQKEGAYDTQATIKIGESAFFAFSGLKANTPGAKLAKMNIILYNAKEGISVRSEVTEGIAGLEMVESISGIELKIPKTISLNDGTAKSVVSGKYRLYLGFETDKKESYSYSFYEIDFVE